MARIIEAMSGEMISFRSNGDEYQGYLSKAAGGGPGVVVIQEYWGLVGHIKSIADRFAEAGFVALAPDFYKGEVATEPEQAGKLMMALHIGETEKNLRSAIDTLAAEPSVRGPKIGVVGFCMGGQLALFAATLNDKIGACVDYYGIHPNVKPDYTRLTVPLLGFFAEHDSYASPESVARMDAELTTAGKPHEFKTYPGTHHAFFNDGRPEVYDAAAAADSWARMLEFFRRNLG